MIPVYQDQFDYGRGNCMWAAIASVFEVNLEQFRLCAPPCGDDIRKWTEIAYPHLTFHYRDLCTNYRVVKGFPDVPNWRTGRWAWDDPDQDAWEPPPAEYWIASVHSQRLKRPVEDGYYPMPALHAVVMNGHKMVHDPNPKNGAYTPIVCGQSWWA